MTAAEAASVLRDQEARLLSLRSRLRSRDAKLALDDAAREIRLVADQLEATWGVHVPPAAEPPS